MATTACDTHAAVQELRDSGFHEEGASAAVQVVQRAQEERVTKTDLAHLATKEDLLQLRGDLYRAILIQIGANAAILVAVLALARFLGL